jgi:hypothetical protein
MLPPLVAPSLRSWRTMGEGLNGTGQLWLRRTIGT